MFLTYEMIEHYKINVNDNRIKLAYFMLIAARVSKVFKL